MALITGIDVGPARAPIRPLLPEARQLLRQDLIAAGYDVQPED